MKCCSHCFVSPHLKDKINRNKSIGNCDFCETLNVSTIDPRELSPIFQSIFDLYILNDNGRQPAAQITQDFSGVIFLLQDLQIIDRLLKEIFADDLQIYGEFFESSIILIRFSLRKCALARCFN